MRKLFSFVVFLFSSIIALSQPYGNEWINYNQKYYKFPVTEDGVYRIDYYTLSPLGLNNIDPRNFMLIGRGDTIPIYISGESDGIFDLNDYIEFYAKRNDGWLDSALYNIPENQSNPYYSLINDTAVYYLSYNTSVNNKRYKAESDVNYSTYSSSPFFWKESTLYYNSEYHYAEEDPMYTEGEGWADAAIGLGGNIIKNLETKNVYTLGPAAVLSTNVVGSSRNEKRLLIEYSSNGSAYNTLADVSFYGYKLNKFPALSTSSANLGTNTTEIKFSSLSPGVSTTGRLAVCFLSLKYPHTYDLEGKSYFKMNVPSSGTKITLPITNFTGTLPVFYDIENGLKIPLSSVGSDFYAVLPQSSFERKCVLVDETQIKEINNLYPVSSTAYFTKFSGLDKDYLIISDPKLSLDEYSQYRSSITGGSHQVLVVNVNELYDQFSYGIEKHPISIRSFCDFTLKTWSVKPRNLFLVGKGIHANYFRKNSTQFSNCIVPSFGNPSSDILFTSGLEDSLYVPAIPVGRLAAKTTDEVLLYLQKVEHHESNMVVTGASQTLANKEWMKTILHFGGGESSIEQTTFQTYLSAYEEILEDKYFSGKVHTFLKTTSSPIQITTSDSIKNLINNGTSIMTFFGHAAGSSFDQSIQEPEDYNNYKKYPLIVANSCFIGDIHLPLGTAPLGTSEKFIFAANRGALAFMAQVGLGYPHVLYNYTSNFFQNLGKDNYGQSIGQCMQQTIRDVQNANDLLLKAGCLEMTLHGDPALVLNAHAKPDIIIEPQEISFNPSVITEETDSFKLNINLKNIGKGTDETFVLEVIRTFPDLDTVKRVVLVNGIDFAQNLTVTFPVDKIKGIGPNTFEIIADAGSLIDELSELNNRTSVQILITSSAVSPVYPYKYAIVPNDTIVLKATTGDPFAPSRKYRFEIDTTDFFNSPFKKEQIVEHPGGVVNAFYNSWKSSSTGISSPLILSDSVVYFWRVSPDTVGSSNTNNWRESSFQYIKNKRGWEQAHFFQFKNDNYKFISYNRNGSNRQFDFIPNYRTLYCQTYGIPTLTELYSTEYRLDASIQSQGGCQPVPAIHVAVIDSITLEPWSTGDYFFGNANTTTTCRKEPENYFIFHTVDPVQMAGLKNMLNTIPNGAHVLLFSFISGNFQNWADTSAFANIAQLGAQRFRTLPSDIPYIFYAKKGYTATAIEKFSINPDTALTLQTTLVNNRTFGEITSELIGPSTNWDSLYWDHHSIDGGASQDSISLKIIGINYSGQETVLGSIPAINTAINIDTINAGLYPYLKLKAYLSDPLNQTPAQLDKWQVLYSGVGDVAINQSRFFQFQSSSVDEGDEIKFKVAVENISDYSMDSLLVSYQIQDKDRRMKSVLYKKLKPLAPGDTLITSVSFSTLGLGGNNSLWLEVNPINKLTNRYDQPEQYHFNNFAQVGFTASGDKKNPLLDVTFDGTHIMDGDIVSAKPEILIQLRDDNKFLAMDTASVFKVFIKEPGAEIDELLTIDNDVLKFIPASLPDNKCRIEYRPHFAKDGIYELSVQAKDASNNRSGDIDYRISFEVINKSTITNVVNYPNPFSTSTRFAFTLTGSEIPTTFKIQVLTITGKVVREISETELGEIRIGKNLTEFAWDGKDEFGDQLANGVYLYKVFCRINGNTIERRQSAADTYFVKGFGKMYLLK